MYKNFFRNCLSPRTASATSSNPAISQKYVGGAASPMATAVSPQNAGGEVHVTTKKQRVNGSEKFDITVAEGGDSRYGWALAEAQGRRPGMEDAHSVVLDLGDGTAFFGVFDGHAGSEVAAFCARHMPSMVAKNLPGSSHGMEGALQQSFMQLDAVMADPSSQAELYALRKGVDTRGAPEPSGPAAGVTLSSKEQHHAQSYGMFDDKGSYIGPKAGSTALVALTKGSKLIVGSVGDSRCILSRGGHAVKLTRDHKPDRPDEAARIYSAGETVEPNRAGGVPRVGGTLAMSRAMGDTKYKDNPDLPREQQAVTAVPDTAAAPVTPGHDFMVLACDGLWDVMTAEQVVAIVHQELMQGTSPGTIVRRLVAQSLGGEGLPAASSDNITAMLVVFLSNHM